MSFMSLAVLLLVSDVPFSDIIHFDCLRLGNDDDGDDVFQSLSLRTQSTANLRV